MRRPTPYWEDVREGEELPELVTGPITRKQLVMYAGASGDFNPIHYDDHEALRQKLPGVIGHGMLSAAFVAQAVTRWMGYGGRLIRLWTRFTAMTRPGDVVTVWGHVTDRELRPEGGWVKIALEAAVPGDGEDRVVVMGEAEVLLPCREREAGVPGSAARGDV